MQIRKNTTEIPEITTPTEDITAEDNAFLDRDTYRKIKKMDRESMQSFLADIYESGRQKEREVGAIAASDTTDDAEDTPELDMRVLVQQIKSIKGVGEKRAEEIMVVIEKWMLGE